MRKACQYTLTFFFVIILVALVYWITPGTSVEQISIVEGRELAGLGKTYPTLRNALNLLHEKQYKLASKIVWDLFTSRSLQKKFDSAAIDQFPIRISLTLFSKAVDQKIIRFSYHFSNDRIIPTDMTSGLYIDLDNNVLIPSPLTFDENTVENIDRRIDNYYEIASRFPTINIYIYYLETISAAPFHPLNMYFANADKGFSFEYFQAKAPKAINFGTFKLDTYAELIKYFYRTDHHWNTYGILKGYDEIYDLLAKNYLNPPQKLEPTAIINFPDIEFSGTYARKTLYPIRGDDFVGFDAQYPVCIVKDQGIVGVYDKKNEYLQGNYLTTPYISHYGLYFGSINGLLEYHCDTGSNRNILVIGDSYSRPLISLIASQYENTYFLDLRRDDTFSLSEFIIQHPIDDLLVIGSAHVVLIENDQWMINP